MKIRKYLLAMCSLIMIACDNDENQTLCYGVHDQLEGDITLAGAVGDGKTDCSTIINQMIASLPAEGGIIVIPEGDFVLDEPIVINKDNVTIKGLNPGFRSNIDVKDESLLGPGGGSKLILRKADAAIKLGNSDVSKLAIKNILISGGTENHGTGILFESTNTDCSIKNVIGINLKLGFDIRKATRMQISDCWVCEMESSIKLQSGEQNSVKNCQLGAQPKGITCMFAKEKNLVFEKNQVYPDGSSNLVLDECDDAKISNNNFKSYYIGILNMSGNRNKVENNIFWMADAVANQLLDRGAEYGVVCIAGEENHFIQNTLTCEWIVENGVTVRATEGKNNLIENCLIENTNSNQVLLVNDQMKVLNCVPKDKIKIEQQD